MTSLLDREERQTLRRVQAHLREKIFAAGAVVEQLGTVDTHFHPTNPDPHLNCATPHRGVAWVRRDDLSNAFTGLERLGRVPRLVFQDALFPQAFQQQIELMGLTLEETRVMMVYRPICGPDLPGETPRGRIPQEFDKTITVSVPTDANGLARWLRVFRAGYFNTELLVVEASAVEPLVAAADNGEAIFVMAHYQQTPLAAARVDVRGSSAEIEAVATAPLWHGMGLEVALLATAVRTALERGCEIVFTITPSDDFTRMCRDLGFVDLTRVLTFWLAEEYATLAPQDTSGEGET